MSCLAKLCALVALAASVLISCSPPPSRAGDISVAEAWTPATPAGARVGAGYMTIANAGTETVRLVGGESAVAERVEVHSMTIDGGVMRMRPMDNGLEIPAGGAVELEPAGMHLMLIGLKRPLAAGETVPVTLKFDNGARIDAALTVRAIGGG